ncbi:NADH-quinone oxidoreductase subunit E 2 (NADH dehydrogenase I subunit E 2) (NDH-1 subunit E 2) [Candidatus Methylomirabilis lanthanidiphila]|uniref:NADH-quinone oxidoreductase subunit E 2 (NADH dehydrogenase I subunit E 2) (NDH-1 subunit E 2) n=1 Tax=Candidatus Methylomirabilis lanthanidiphila TaxID=2211376 RepID=A0A564ZFU0_9BACT|nr:NAD(P)H-dependent oxidoreductase subunit E [Candidatus Methylomirabilis lanthanidiphila]VUZ84023.1 NADH-quinone oxidoreductase subunit E 2 (NADH dehydrogenase I subunit E 2) (NDH-1 subunit E 2) [Candidatus Methylomirabilis lanthanidiphila]
MTEETIQRILSKYPDQRSALLPLMHLYQEEAGYLTEDAMRELAARLDVPPIQVAEVATFYDMFRLKPGGQREIWVCHNLSCALLGAEQVIRRLEETLGVSAGETTPDGLFTIKRVECLAACGRAPAIQVGPDYYGPVSTDDVDTLVAQLKQQSGSHL